MIKKIIELFSVFDRKDKIKLIILQIMILFATFLELISIASIAPFMSLIGDIDQIYGDGYIAAIYRCLGEPKVEMFLFYAALFCVIMLLLSAIASVLLNYYKAMVGASFSISLQKRLFNYYMCKDWAYHIANNSSNIMNKLNAELNRLQAHILSAALNLNAKLVLCLSVLLIFFIADPSVAFGAITIFGFAYVVIFRFLKIKMDRNGKIISHQNNIRFNVISEVFGGIKDIHVLDRYEFSRNRFKAAIKDLYYAGARTSVYSEAPRFIVEFISFVSILGFVLYVVHRESGDLASVLPIISVYALAGFKLLPSFQQIYYGLTTIASNMSAYDVLRNDLTNSAINNVTYQNIEEDSINESVIEEFKYWKRIELDNVEFSYANTELTAINNLSLQITRGEKVGFVGSSGSGKSTTIDIILGLLYPTKGTLSVDGVEIGVNNAQAWRSQIGYVPQSIYLSDKSIAENIAFGIPKNEINHHKIQLAASKAALTDFVSKLPNGFNSIVGERGVQLSGGQRQRIGIARALYHDPAIIIFDEATSALDNLTEKYVMDVIDSLDDTKTVILIAHRLTTVKKCDKILMLESGVLSACGSYEELLSKSPEFKKMADV